MKPKRKIKTEIVIETVTEIGIVIEIVIGTEIVIVTGTEIVTQKDLTAAEANGGGTGIVIGVGGIGSGRTVSAGVRKIGNGKRRGQRETPTILKLLSLR